MRLSNHHDPATLTMLEAVHAGPHKFDLSGARSNDMKSNEWICGDPGLKLPDEYLFVVVPAREPRDDIASDCTAFGVPSKARFHWMSDQGLDLEASTRAAGPRNTRPNASP